MKKKFGPSGVHFAGRISGLRKAERSWMFAFDPHGIRFVFSLYNPERGYDIRLHSEWSPGKPGGKVVMNLTVTKSSRTPQQQFTDVMRLKSFADQQGWKSLSEQIRRKWKAGKIPELERTECDMDTPIKEVDGERKIRVAWIKAIDLALTTAEKLTAREAPA